MLSRYIYQWGYEYMVSNKSDINYEPCYFKKGGVYEYLEKIISNKASLYHNCNI
jgi:hypothetical protein